MSTRDHTSEQDQAFPALTSICRRVWEFDKLGDFDWVAAGTGVLFPLSGTGSQSGQMPLTLPATNSIGFTAYAPPECIYLGKRMFVRMKWLMSLSAVQFCDFGFGLTTPENGWLSGSNYLKQGVILRKDSGDFNLDLLVASNNASNSNPIETADTMAAVRQMGTGLAIWSMEIYTDDNVLGEGVVRLFVNNKIFHAQRVTKLPYGVALCPSFGLYNGEAAARTLSIDRIELEYSRYTTTTPTATLTSSGGTSGGTSGDGGSGSGGNGGGSGGGNDCIAMGTLVALADGTQAPVELLEVGQMLRSPSGPVALQEIRKPGVRPCVKVLTFTGESVVCTETHPFMVSGEQVEAINLAQGAPLEAIHGLSAYSSQSFEDNLEVFSLTVEGGLFYAGGILTHNKDVPLTPSPGSYPTAINP